MSIVRRVFLLALVAVSGIALLAPLSARSAAQLPDPLPDRLLVAARLPRADAPRGAVLSARGSGLEAAATGATESVASGSAQGPTAVPMEPSILAVPTAIRSRPVATFSGEGVWDALARCESGGNWAINTGNGYYGGLQFSLGTWNGYGGAEFAEYPHQATREEQIVVGERLRAVRGYAPWPACRAKLGLP
jgi:Transglycosylase-like domain